MSGEANLCWVSKVVCTRSNPQGTFEMANIKDCCYCHYYLSARKKLTELHEMARRVIDHNQDEASSGCERNLIGVASAAPTKSRVFTVVPEEKR